MLQELADDEVHAPAGEGEQRELLRRETEEDLLEDVHPLLQDVATTLERNYETQTARLKKGKKGGGFKSFKIFALRKTLESAI